MTVKIVSENQCYGCAACFNACPVRAIEMKADKEGFVRPVVNEDVCVNCNKCEKVCPALHCDELKNNYAVRFFAVQNSNANMVKKSSSGGIFALLAEHILAQKGVVYGAAFDDENVLRHVRVDDFAELEKLLGSKYVQSDIGSVFMQVRADLHEHKQVLFMGTPCQVAGLKAFLGKNYDNLLLVDLLCHGVPSPEVWKLYLKNLGIREKTHIEFRNKDKGWKNYSLVIDGKVHDLHSENSYMLGFLNNLYLRKSCYQCQFCGVKRCSDFTLGDFWGVSSYRQHLDDDKGTSVVMVNSPKAGLLLEKLKEKVSFCEQVPADAVILGNPSLSKPATAHVAREEFFSALQKEQNWKSLADMFIKTNVVAKHKVGILNLQHSSNFGACLVAYALQKAIEKTGNRAEIIDFRPESQVKKSEYLHKGKFFEEFRQAFLKRSQVCWNFDDLSELNSKYDTFVVGSDQVWRYLYSFRNLPEFFLEFADNGKNLISYAASFGVDCWEGSDEATEQVKKDLTRFSAVSVRETSGVDICQNMFHVDATQVLDPTLLLQKEDYEPIIEKEAQNNNIDKKYIAYMLLDDNSETMVALQSIANEKNLELVDIYNNPQVQAQSSQFRHIGEWLNLIKNAEFVVTDSFHCVCFSLIFKKDFLCVINSQRGASRLESLLGSLNLETHLVDKLEKKSVETVGIDYDIVEPLLKEKQKSSFAFLKESLDLMPKTKANKKEIKTLKLFNKFVLWRTIKKGHVSVGRLFNMLPVWKTIQTRNRCKYLLFACIPIFEIIRREK